MKSTNESGFSLVEMAIVVMIIGLLLAGAMFLLKPYLEMSQANLTRKKMENISSALASFAQTYGRLPCPSDADSSASNPPYGSPRRSGSNGLDFVKDNCGTSMESYVGIIPFRAIGLTEDQVRDNYGNMITYAVSPAMTNEEYKQDDMNSGDVHAMCRRPQWMETSGGANKNSLKARVCCPDYHAWDIKVTNLGADVFSSLPRTNSGYDHPNTPISSSITPEVTNQIIAFVLVSHGANGDAALMDPSGIRRIMAPATAAESLNRNPKTNLNFRDERISRAQNNNYFDDIVVWKTNTQLYSMTGKDSCARP